MSPTNPIVDRYIHSWNETDPVRRRTLVQTLYTEQALYTDPMGEALGWEAIDAMVAAAQAMFPHHRFSLGGAVDAHHQIARFQWHLTAPGSSEPLVIGFDVVELDQGRIARVLGFLDQAPSL